MAGNISSVLAISNNGWKRGPDEAPELAPGLATVGEFTKIKSNLLNNTPDERWGFSEDTRAATWAMKEKAATDKGYTRVVDFDPNDKISEYFIWDTKDGVFYAYGKFVSFDDSTKTPQGDKYISMWKFDLRTFEKNSVNPNNFPIESVSKNGALYKKNGTPEPSHHEEDTPSHDISSSSKETPSSRNPSPNTDADVAPKVDAAQSNTSQIIETGIELETTPANQMNVYLRLLKELNNTRGRERNFGPINSPTNSLSYSGTISSVFNGIVRELSIIINENGRELVNEMPELSELQADGDNEKLSFLIPRGYVSENLSLFLSKILNTLKPTTEDSSKLEEEKNKIEYEISTLEHRLRTETIAINNVIRNLEEEKNKIEYEIKFRKSGGGTRKRSSTLSRKRSGKQKYYKKSRNMKRKSKRRRSFRI